MRFSCYNNVKSQQGEECTYRKFVEIGASPYVKDLCRRIAELGIVYAGMTPSRHGLRLVAKCRPEFQTIAECQQWLGEQIGKPMPVWSEMSEKDTKTYRRNTIAFSQWVANQMLVQHLLLLSGNNTAAKHVIYQWNLLGSIEVLEEGVSSRGHKLSVRFRKRQK